MAETSSLPSTWEVHAVLRIFLLDQNKDNYLIIQDTIGRQRRFHRMKPESGVDQLIPLKTFNDSRNGYLVDDTCVLGAEVFVSKEMSTGNGEGLTMFKDGVRDRYTWKIENFSNLDKHYYDSKQFAAGNYKWNIRFYPNGKGIGLGGYISLYLDLAEAEALPAGTKVLAEFTLRVLDQIQSRNYSGKATHWFTASNPELGWVRFMSFAAFMLNGPLIKDCCFVDAEVSILGVVNRLS
ncbi:hypothetical protein SAY86_027911 [Trapa natans]|uniref:MATH domain-containing protein n=1 Tax=Trapa natans TaxID=22666 RepID=A0AAN7LYU7_TRANT|nr:hypothetical protein SAY86_027911 [Trapa natans]